MKMMVGVLIGFVLATIVTVAATVGFSSAKAASDPASSTPASSTAVIPPAIADFYHIYTESLKAPFQQARAKITDPDIRDFYDKLIDRSGILKDSDAGTADNLTAPAPAASETLTGR